MAFNSLDNRKLTIRLDLDYRKITAQGKPTQVTRGLYSGFSFPIYNSDNEEVFFHIKTPERWNGVTNPIIRTHVYLASAEDVGDSFQFQLAYESNNCTGVLSTSGNEAQKVTTILTDRNAQYDVYCVDFELDATKIGDPGCILTGRLRRLSTTGTEVAGEIVLFDWVAEFKRNKIGGIYN